MNQRAANCPSCEAVQPGKYNRPFPGRGAGECPREQFGPNPVPLCGLRDLRAVLIPVRVLLARRQRSPREQFGLTPIPPSVTSVR